MDVQVLAVRNLTYRMFVDGGRAPTVDEVAREGDLTSAEVEASWRELHRAHALVLNPATIEIRMANPFSAVPTAYRCGERIALEVLDERVDDERLLFHCLVPAVRWWDDIVFT